MKTTCASFSENNQQVIVTTNLDNIYKHLGSFGIRRLAHLLAQDGNAWKISDELNISKCVITLLRARQGLIWVYLQNKNKPASVIPFKQMVRNTDLLKYPL